MSHLLGFPAGSSLLTHPSLVRASDLKTVPAADVQAIERTHAQTRRSHALPSRLPSHRAKPDRRSRRPQHRVSAYVCITSLLQTANRNPPPIRRPRTRTDRHYAHRFAGYSCLTQINSSFAFLRSAPSVTRENPDAGYGTNSNRRGGILIAFCRVARVIQKKTREFFPGSPGEGVLAR